LWFNPIIYQFQQRITVLHEYLSDEEIIKQTNAKTYFNKLLSETFNVENITFINQFYKQNLIKKRIAMITKNKSKKMKQLKYLLIVPLLFAMLVYVSCTDDVQTTINQVENALKEDSIPSEGKYFRAENGFILFTGTHLDGKVVPFDEMTAKEKEIFRKFNNVENSNFQYSLVIDANGDRVHFIKVPTLPVTNKASDKIIVEKDNSIPFAVIDEVPIYPGCKGDQAALRKCLQENITQFVGTNFNANLANNLGLSAGVKRIFVMFKIDKEGNITEVKARAPHIKLEEEAIRVVSSLPKMIPGKQKGENVTVKYSLPIAIKVEDYNLNNDNTNSILLNSENNKITPLFILNGKEITKEELNKIDSKLIKNMNVLKGEKAISKYGEKGKNGVIEIVLKN
jgi:hypothetical protein